MKKYILSLICVGVILGCIGTAVGLMVMSSGGKKTDADNSPTAIENQINNAAEASENVEPPVNPDPAAKLTLVTPETKLVFESLYQADNQTKVTNESPPYFLLGLSEDKIQKYYPDWDIVQFDESTVKLRRVIPAGTGDLYVLGVKDNYVAVYQKLKNGTVSLKEITGTPVGALPQDEQSKLVSGISVQNDAQLAQMLQDYGS